MYVAGNFTRLGGVDGYGLGALDARGLPSPFHNETIASPANWVFAPRTVQCGFGQVLVAGTVSNSPTYSTVYNTVAILDPRSTAQSPFASLAVPDDPWTHPGWPVAEALALHGDIMYVGGASAGRSSSAVVPRGDRFRNGSFTGWDPNPPP